MANFETVETPNKNLKWYSPFNPISSKITNKSTNPQIGQKKSYKSSIEKVPLILNWSSIFPEARKIYLARASFQASNVCFSRFSRKFKYPTAWFRYIFSITFRVPKNGDQSENDPKTLKMNFLFLSESIRSFGSREFLLQLFYDKRTPSIRNRNGISK